jgi:hypothetical protein
MSRSYLLGLALALTATHAATGTAGQLDQPFALHNGESITITPLELTLTLRSLAPESGCLSANDCSAMLFRGTLVSRFGARTALHELDALIAADAPAEIKLVEGYDLSASSVRPDAKGRLTATFTLSAHHSTVAEVEAEAEAADEPPDRDVHFAAAPAPASNANGPTSEPAQIISPQLTHRTLTVRRADAKPQLWIDLTKSSLNSPGWTLFIDSAEPLSKLEVRAQDSNGWTKADGSGKEFYVPVGFLDAKAEIPVRATTADGGTLAPITLAFDPLSLLRERDQHELSMLSAIWVEFNDEYAYFTMLFIRSCAVREVRYSIDSKALDQRMPVPPCSLRDHGRLPAGDTEVLHLAHPPEYMAVQVVYFDGSESPVQTVRKGLH